MIDFHCHLDLYPNPQAIADECAKRGLYVLSVTTTPSAWRGTAALAHGHPRIRTALGLHPQLVHQRKSEFPLFEKLLPETAYVGEIGLDGAPEFKASWSEQLSIFNRILTCCANEGGRIVSIHSRRATKAVLDTLAAQPNAWTFVLHWFSGTNRELDRAAAMGCWFSIGPAMLLSNRGRTLAAHMPRDRVLTETDGPFAQLNGVTALPWDAALAMSALAELWSIDEGEVTRMMTENFTALGRRADELRRH